MDQINKIILSFFLLISLLVPTTQVFADTSTNPVCVDLTETTYIGFADVGINGGVSVLQKFLIEQNLLDSSPTGYFGSLTTKAVKKFQLNHNIEPTGIVGPLTRAQIKKMTCNTSPLVISNISPIADIVGASFKITGSGFGDKNTILIGSDALNNIPSSQNGTVIDFVLPEYISPYCSTGSVCTTMVNKINSNTKYEISVINRNKQSNKKTFTIKNKDSLIKINSLSKTSGEIGGAITIFGTGFTDSNTILFGNGVIKDITSSKDGKELLFKIPSKLYPECYYDTPACKSPVSTTTEDIYEVQVKNVYGTSNSKTFTVAPPTISGPSISSISPTSGKAGSSVTISGSGFNAPNLKIKFESEIIENVSSNGNGTKITFTVPRSIKVCTSVGGSMYSAYIPPSDKLSTVCSYKDLPFDSYRISVQNLYGVSNSKKFTVKSSSSSY